MSHAHLASADALEAYWALPEAVLLRHLDSAPSGLSSRAAALRLPATGAATDRPRAGAIRTLLDQFRSPILLILLAAATLSYFLRDPADALIILTIVVVSGGLGFVHEWRASAAVTKLLARVQSRTTVLRDGHSSEIPAQAVVPGDVVLLSAGSSVPGDCRLLASKDLCAVEAALTGETFPVDKRPGEVAADAPLARRSNCLFLGTYVATGTARALVVRTGDATAFGAIAQRLRLRPPETEFEHGVRRFGYFLAEVTGLRVLGIFAVNVYLERPIFEAFLFSLALAVGLTPQLLPAVITVNLAHGARRMAEAKVIVKRLSSIENLGSMDVLCADKTGTLTEGTVRVHADRRRRGQGE